MSTLPLTTPDNEAVLLERSSQPGHASFGSKLLQAAQGHFSFALADQVVYSFGNMVVAALMSRHVSPLEFGVYILTQRALDVLIQLCNVFLWAPYTFHLPGMSEARQRRYQGSVVLWQTVFLAVFTGLLYAAALGAAGQRHGGLHGIVAPLVFTSGAILFREFTRRLYFAHLRMQEAFWTEFATVVLQICGVWWLQRRGALGVASALGVLALGAALVSLWWIMQEWQRWSVSFLEAKDDFKRDLRLGRWFFGSNMIFLASAQCNPWVLNAVMGGQAVGAYAIAESLVNIPRVALTSMQNMMGPMLVRAQIQGGPRKVAGLVRRLNLGLLFGSGVFAAAIWIFGPFVARLIYRHIPSNTQNIAMWLAINLVVYACTLAQSYALTALGRANVTFYVNVFGLLAQAAVCLSLVRRFHVPGAAMALLVGSIIVLLLRHWVYSRELKTS